MPGSPWGGAGGLLLTGNWIPGRAEQQEAGRPLCPPIIPSPPGPLSPSNRGLSSSLGAVGNEGVTSVSPSLPIPCPRGFCTCPPTLRV